MIYYIQQNANNLFVKIPHSIPFLKISSRSLFHSLSWRNPVRHYVEEENVKSWTLKISGFTREYEPEKAIGCFKLMLLNHQKPNFVTVLSVIRAVRLLHWEMVACCFHGFTVKAGFESEAQVVTALLGVYSAWDNSGIRKLFDQIPHKDVVSWSAMISACLKNKECVEALEYFREMQLSGVVPNHVSIVCALPACAYLGILPLGKEIHGFSLKRAFCDINLQNALLDMYAKCKYLKYSIEVFIRMKNKDLVSWRSIIRGCLENHFPDRSLVMFSEMRSCCSEVDENIIHDVILASSQLEEIRIGLGVHGLVLKMGYLNLISIGTALLTLHSLFGEVGSARILFDSLNCKDVVAWTAMISAYAQNEQPFNAFNIFRQMQSAGVKPNEVTFVSLLQSCSSMAAQEIGESIHGYLYKAGLMPNTFLKSALIDMYCKFGGIQQGETLFNENATKSLVCWSSMINGYGINGFGQEALHYFSNMLNTGIEPNDVVFISILSACSHCGLEYEGWSWFSAMEVRYGLVPKVAHYACMVDMLSRQGYVEEALEFVKNMPVEPDKRIWGALLAGCRKTHGYSEISEHAAKQLIRLDPKNSSNYMILSNLYAEEDRWEEVEQLRELMEANGLKKEIGYSMI